jgi:hypothetical protein
VKSLQKEADLHEGKARLLQMNKHSFIHNSAPLCYKKIFFFFRFCLSGENQHGTIARAFKSPLDYECIAHYPGIAPPCQPTDPKQVACSSKFI